MVAPISYIQLNFKLVLNTMLIYKRKFKIMSGKDDRKGKGKPRSREELLNNEPHDEKMEVDDLDDDASVASDEDLYDRTEAEETAGFRVQLGSQLKPKSNPSDTKSSIRIKAEGGEKVCFDLGDDEDQKLSEKAQEELRNLHKETTDLRLQKIYQHDKYHTPSPPATLNQDFFNRLHVLLETENYKFKNLSREELEERKHEIDPIGNKIYKYTKDQAQEFDIAGTNLHNALAIKKTGENNFTITHTATSPSFSSHPYTSQVDVSFKDETSTKKIAIKGKQDNISVMLLAAITAKEKLGENANYYIYSSKNKEGLAELFARAEIYGLDPKPLKRPEQSDEEFKKFEELVNSEEFKQRIEHYKSIHQLSNNHLPSGKYKDLKALKLAEAKQTDDPSDPAETSSSESDQPTDRDVATSSNPSPRPHSGPNLRRMR